MRLAILWVQSQLGSKMFVSFGSRKEKKRSHVISIIESVQESLVFSNTYSSSKVTQQNILVLFSEPAEEERQRGNDHRITPWTLD